MNNSHYELSNLESCLLVAVVQKHSTLHFIKRLAHSEPNGMPEQSVLEAPSQKYVLEVSNLLNRIKSAFSDSYSFLKQIEIPPPDNWLKEMELTVDSYRQQLLDLFTIVIHSVADRVLLLLNFLFDLDIPLRSCSFRKVKDAIDRIDKSIGALLVQLKSATEPISDPRHFFIHRGEYRYVPLFSDIHRVKDILKAFRSPTEGIVFNDPEALSRLLESMRKDLSSVRDTVIPLLDSLCAVYNNRLIELGGPDVPSQDEIIMADAVLEYYRGGPKPDFMK